MKYGFISLLVALGFAAGQQYIDTIPPVDEPGLTTVSASTNLGNTESIGISAEPNHAQIISETDKAVNMVAVISNDHIKSVGLDVDKTNNVTDKVTKVVAKHKIISPDLMPSAYMACVREAMLTYLEYRKAIEQPPITAEAKNKAEEYLRLLADILAGC